MSITFLRRKDVERETGLSTSAIYSLMSKNEFPKPVPITQSQVPRVAWVESEIRAWQKAKIEKRDTAA